MYTVKDFKIGRIIIFTSHSWGSTSLNYGIVVKTYKTIEQVLVRTPLVDNHLMKIPFDQIGELFSFKKSKIYKFKNYYE